MYLLPALLFHGNPAIARLEVQNLIYYHLTLTPAGSHWNCTFTASSGQFISPMSRDYVDDNISAAKNINAKVSKE